MNCAFWSDNGFEAARTDIEPFKRATETGGVDTTTYLHLYRNPAKGYQEAFEFVHKLDEAIEKKNKGVAIDPDEWRQYSHFAEKKDDVWHRKQKELDEKTYLEGCMAIRTNCVSDPFLCLRIYRARDVVEKTFGQFKGVGGDTLRVTRSSYIGKILVYSLAQALRGIQTVTARRNDKDALPIPGDSLELMMQGLDRVCAVRAVGRRNWIVKPFPKEERDSLELLGIKQKIPRMVRAE